MLTIRVISGTHEFVKSDVTSVSYDPGVPSDGLMPMLTAFYKDDAPESFLYGRMYVMNENGKTVANYEIWPLPIGEEEVKVTVE